MATGETTAYRWSQRGYIVEDGVRGEKRRPGVDGGRSDPEVVGVDGFVQGVSREAAGVAKVGCGGQQRVGYRYDGGHLRPTAPVVGDAGRPSRRR